ncbi:MAG: helix-turn-helix transcriptional regulator, partial [Treponema sp.]|nr:helix-turn-helix transcriptional regulator [Treponema sp.]
FMPINVAVAETLRELRQKKGVSQEKLAEAIDSHQVYISEIENGKKIPSLSVIYKTAQFFNLSLSDFAALIEEKL